MTHMSHTSSASTETLQEHTKNNPVTHSSVNKLNSIDDNWNSLCDNCATCAILKLALLLIFFIINRTQSIKRTNNYNCTHKHKPRNAIMFTIKRTILTLHFMTYLLLLVSLLF